VTAQEIAATLRTAAEGGRGVRIRGGGTKAGWGRPVEPGAELATGGLDAIVEHNVADLTAVLQAGVPLARAQEAFAQAGQTLAVDPPDDGATVGGVVATGDSGPIRHRYGAVRDLVVGVRVALPDGSVARAGG
jgi:glycolate oxidase FAD binding subunit